MEQHLYMFSGKLVRAGFRAKPYMINDFADSFGKNINVKTVDIVLTYPQNLREQVTEKLKNALKNNIHIRFLSHDICYNVITETKNKQFRTQ